MENKQDLNKIIDTINAEWAESLSNANRRIAVLVDNLRIQNEQLESKDKIIEKQQEKIEGYENINDDLRQSTDT